MFTLATHKKPKTLKSWELKYLVAALLCFLFGTIYAQFSHGVCSIFMQYAFAIPLVGGTLALFLLDLFSQKIMPGKTTFSLYCSGIAALTVGSILEGVLEIYGTTNHLVFVYPLVGFSLIFTSAVVYIIGAIYFHRNDT